MYYVSFQDYLIYYNAFDINVVIIQKNLQSIEERFCDFYKSYILGEKEEENRIIANKK